MHVGPGLDQQPYHGFVLRVMIVTQFIHGMVQRCELMPFKTNKETGNINTETQKHTGNGKNNEPTVLYNRPTQHGTLPIVLFVQFCTVVQEQFDHFYMPTKRRGNQGRTTTTSHTVDVRPVFDEQFSHVEMALVARMH